MDVDVDVDVAVDVAVAVAARAFRRLDRMTMPLLCPVIGHTEKETKVGTVGVLLE